MASFYICFSFSTDYYCMFVWVCVYVFMLVHTISFSLLPLSLRYSSFSRFLTQLTLDLCSFPMCVYTSINLSWKNCTCCFPNNFDSHIFLCTKFKSLSCLGNVTLFYQDLATNNDNIRMKLFIYWGVQVELFIDNTLFMQNSRILGKHSRTKLQCQRIKI